ncbi:DUF7282 domain-containing protein [Halorussus amylolyticus]|uniref:DUF7282 domain-containing protein n=1 Tax=Halorussus amylolyticus TaxID=1126242 RepID=UPI00192F4276|nr:hypothetical protein [Halorussus amylolyticus]
MVRKTALVALVALLVVGGSAAALGATPAATDAPAVQNDAPMVQDDTTEENETDEDDEDDEETTEMDDEDEETTEMTTTVAENETESATVTFENQTSNGSAVVVNETNLPEGGFVVIHTAANVTGETYDDPANASIGPVVGNSTYLEAGTHENVTVELNETLEESQPLVAMAHQDTDDDQEYNFPEADGPYTQDNLPVVDLALVTLEDGEMNETTEMTETTEEDEMTTEMDDEDEETTTEE